MKSSFFIGFILLVSFFLSSSLSLPVPPHKFNLKLEEAFPWTFDGPVDFHYSLPGKDDSDAEDDYYYDPEDSSYMTPEAEEEKKCKKDELLYVAERKGKIWVFPNCKSADFEDEDAETDGSDMKDKKKIFLDISDRLTTEGEMGLLGFAFHPQFPKNPHVYLSYVLRKDDGNTGEDEDEVQDGDEERDVYTEEGEVDDEILANLKKGKSIVHYISKFKVTSRKEADKKSEKVLMKFYKPSTLHQGGSIFFGKHDQYLYISLGDSKRPKEAQNPYSYLGKILRIDINLKKEDSEAMIGEPATDFDDQEELMNEDEAPEIEEGVDPEEDEEDYDIDPDVDRLRIETIAEEEEEEEEEEANELDAELNDRWYGIPKGNPFAKGGGYPEILALGFRNPWRCSSDVPQKGNKEFQEVWCGDVGDKTWEEVNLIEPGKNYGWPIMEGFWCWEDIHCNEEKHYTLPFYAYPHPDILDRGGRSSDTELSLEERERDNSHSKWPYFPPVKYQFPFNGSSIVGGYIYQGDKIPWLKHGYVFGDYSGEKMGAFFYEGVEVTWVTEIVTPEEFTRGPIAFGVDSENEFYILTQGRNRPLYKFAGWP